MPMLCRFSGCCGQGSARLAQLDDDHPVPEDDGPIRRIAGHLVQNTRAVNHVPLLVGHAGQVQADIGLQKLSLIHISFALNYATTFSKGALHYDQRKTV